MRFKFVTLCFTAVMLALFFIIAFSRSYITDPASSIKQIEYTKAKEFGRFQARVSTGIHVENFSFFDMIGNRFIVDLIVWFEFNNDEVMLDTISKFSFENGKIIKKSPPDIKLSNGKTFAKYRVRVELNANLNYHNFPMENHRFPIAIANGFFTPQEIIFVVSNTAFVIDPHIFIANWKVGRLITDYGYYESALDQVDSTKKVLEPVAIFTIEFIKRGIRKAFIIFIPIFIAFFLALFSFLMLLNNVGGRARLAVYSISALLGYRFVIETVMPKVGYFTTTDHVYNILLSLAFVVFVVQTFLIKQNNLMLKETDETKRKKTKAVLHLANDIAFIVVTFLMLVSVGFIIL